MSRRAFAILPRAVGFFAGAVTVSRWRRLLALVAVLASAGGATFMVMPRAGARHRASPSAMRARLPLAAWGPVSLTLGRDDQAYRAVRAGDGFVARNPRQSVTAQFSARGVNVQSGSLTLGLRLRAYGYVDALRAVAPVQPTARSTIGCCTATNS